MKVKRNREVRFLHREWKVGMEGWRRTGYGKVSLAEMDALGGEVATDSDQKSLSGVRYGAEFFGVVDPIRREPARNREQGAH